jgi:hypothetical protein
MPNLAEQLPPSRTVAAGSKIWVVLGKLSSTKPISIPGGHLCTGITGRDPPVSDELSRV